MAKSGLVEHIKKHKLAFFVPLAIALVLIVFFVAKIAIYFNYLLGNDIYMSLGIDKEHITLAHGEKEGVTFETQLTTNPLCKIRCAGSFTDISRGIEIGSFDETGSGVITKSYTLNASLPGVGLELYRFDISCHSVSSFFCHTEEESTTRSHIVTEGYSFTQEELDKKSRLGVSLTSLANDVRNADAYLESAAVLLGSIDSGLDVNELNSTARGAAILLQEAKDKFAALLYLYEKGDYSLLERNVADFDSEISGITARAGDIRAAAVALADRQNILIGKMEHASATLVSLKGQYLSEEDYQKLVQLADRYNVLAREISYGGSIFAGGADIDAIAREISDFNLEIYDKTKKKTLEIEADLGISGAILCSFGVCAHFRSVDGIASENEYNYSRACSEVSDMNRSIIESLSNQTLPVTSWGNISLEIRHLKKREADKLLQQLDSGSRNFNLLYEILLAYPEGRDTGYNDTLLLLKGIANELGECNSTPDFTVISIQKEKIYLQDSNPTFTYTLREPGLQCCMFGSCEDCCTNQSCEDENLPVIFLHGHAVNKALSADYSLEGFNDIQAGLENEGFINAGTITVYTKKDTPAGILGLTNLPMTFRGSYYFDVFQQESGEVLVQSKSESIDTYAIRLKDLVETVKYKTGKKKVRIVAFSMGGLVARRYIQLFGTDSVSKLITIGTPNKGITGTILKYCSVIGESLECRDMDESSLFMNKLNSGQEPNIPIVTIIGTGCDMGGEQGDGAVLERNARIDGAKEFIINGTCESIVKPLHLDLRNVEKYPRVYSILLTELKN